MSPRDWLESARSDLLVPFFCSYYQIHVYVLSSAQRRRRAEERSYVAAKFDGKNLPSRFVVGDGRTYLGHENKPLKSGRYQIALLSHVSRVRSFFPSVQSMFMYLF